MAVTSRLISSCRRGNNDTLEALAVTALGVKKIDHDMPPAAASLEGPIVLAAVGQVVAAAGPEEGTEPASLPVGGSQVPPLDQIGEEALNEVAGVVG
jgi:hypothetical protein